MTAVSRRTVLQALGAAVAATHLTGLDGSLAPAATTAPAAVPSPPSYAAIVGLL